MEALTCSTGVGGDLTGQNGTISQRITIVNYLSAFLTIESGLITTHQMYTVRNNKRVIQGIILVVYVFMFGRTRRSVPFYIFVATWANTIT